MTPLVVYSNIIFFYVVQVLVSAHALVRGGGPERTAGGAMFMAAALWSLAQLLHMADFQQVAWTLFELDVGLLVVLMMIAAFADRFWPIWLTSLQIVAVANHGVRAYDPEIVSYAYWLIAGKISYPMLAILFIGTQRHTRRLASGCQEYSWTFQRRRL